jgi:hypothetical protein
MGAAIAPHNATITRPLSDRNFSILSQRLTQKPQDIAALRKSHFSPSEDAEQRDAREFVAARRRFWQLDRGSFLRRD